MVGVTSKTLTPIQMSVLARWTIIPRLLGVPGVANVSIWGERARQLQVQVDPQKLSDANVSLQQVIDTSGNALWVSPLTYLEASTPGTGGFIDTANQRLGIQHISPITTPESLGRVTLEGTKMTARRRRDGRRGSSAADRRRARDDRTRPHVRDREGARREHARRDARDRGRDQGDAARPRRHRVQHDRVPAGHLHRARHQQSRDDADRGGHPGTARARGVPAALARRRDHSRHGAVGVRRRGARPRPHRRDHERRSPSPGCSRRRRS